MQMDKASSDRREKLCLALRKLREDAGLKQVDLANRLGKPQSYISKYESGEKGLEFLEVREICLALGTSFRDFCAAYEDSL